MDGEEQLSIAINFRCIKKYWDQEDVYKDGLEMGYKNVRIKEGDE